MRCTSCSTPSIRSRTARASSCGSKWMSLAPSSAAWKMIELTSRTSGTSEMPSSTSRSSTLVLLDLLAEQGVLGVHRSPECLGGAGQAADLVLDVLARGDAELELVARRQTQLVDRVHVAGVGDRDPERVALECVWQGAHSLEHVDRNLAGGLLVHARQRQVDERQLEAAGQRAGQALRRGDALVQHRLRERASLLDPPPNGRQAVAGDEPGRLDQVCDELGDLVDTVARGQPGGVPGGGFGGAGLAGQPELVGPLEVHGYPSNEVSAEPGGKLSARSGSDMRRAAYAP